MESYVISPLIPNPTLSDAKPSLALTDEDTEFIAWADGEEEPGAAGYERAYPVGQEDEP